MSEWISGVNIPSCQVMIGMGIPLHRIPDVRRMFGLHPAGDSTIDFERDQQAPPLGAHSAEERTVWFWIYAFWGGRRSLGVNNEVL